MQFVPTNFQAKKFFGDLWRESMDDDILNGAAALAYYLTLALFPSLLVLLAVLPFLPIANLDQAVWDLVNQALPGEAAKLLSGTIEELTRNKKSGLLSFGIIATLWAASSGMKAVMEQLNVTYGVKETRSFIRGRLEAMGLTLLLGVLVVTSLILIVAGGMIQDWLIDRVGHESVWLFFFAALRWVIVCTALLTTFDLAYYFGPNVRQKFRFLTPGTVLATTVFVAASLVLRLYVSQVANYQATYGSIGAVIALMLWLWVMGIVFLLGSEVNALLEPFAKTKKAEK